VNWRTGGPAFKVTAGIVAGAGVKPVRGAALLILLGLVACATGDAVAPASASSEMRGWQTSVGKPPSKNEFAAVVAACEDRAKSSINSGPIESCLADYGLRRVQ